MKKEGSKIYQNNAHKYKHRNKKVSLEEQLLPPPLKNNSFRDI